MRKKTIYVAGPMTGIEMFNWPLFFRVAKLLREEGWNVVNPAEQDVIDGINPKAKMNVTKRAEVLKGDFKDIILECDAIAMLPDWRGSEGARGECLLSQLIGNEIYEVSFGSIGNGFALTQVDHDLVRTVAIEMVPERPDAFSVEDIRS